MELSKNYFTIREAAKITGICPHTIRYWEKKTNLIKPIRLQSGHRRYTRKDIENIIMIKDLLYLKGLSFKGINKIIRSKAKEDNNLLDKKRYADLLKKINTEIREIIKKLS